MPRPIIDISGKKFNMLKAMSLAYVNKGAYWNFVCDCGKKKIIRGSSVRDGNIKSCGCLNYKQKHGHAKRSHKNKGTRTYYSWLSMRNRCINKNLKAFKNYGGRGIKVCKRWDKFENFLKDMGECPEDLTLDRIDVNGDYKPSNCRWTTVANQSRNRRGKNNSTSQYKGVVKFSKTKWRARIRHEGKLYCLGLYDKEVEAAKAYNEKAKEYFGEFAYLNPI